MEVAVDPTIMAELPSHLSYSRPLNVAEVFQHHLKKEF